MLLASCSLFGHSLAMRTASSESGKARVALLIASHAFRRSPDEQVLWIICISHRPGLRSITMVELSAITGSVVARLFSPEYRREAVRLLEEECSDNLPFCENSDANALERIRFAVLKISEGDIARLRDAIKIAQQDWRDTLMGAGFGYSVTAHKQWEQELNTRVR